MKKVDDCQNLTEVRNCIDEIDRELVGLIGKRYSYVKKASEFKVDVQHVKAPRRFASMLEKRKEWAKEENLSPEAVENLFRDLVNYFIEEELNTWKQQQNKNS